MSFLDSAPLISTVESLSPIHPNVEENTFWLALICSNSGNDKATNGSSPLCAPKRTSCCGCGTGKFRSAKPLSKLNIAVFAPTPRARVATATAVKPGFFVSIRNPQRMSCQRVSTGPPQQSHHHHVRNDSNQFPGLVYLATT